MGTILDKMLFAKQHTRSVTASAAMDGFYPRPMDYVEISKSNFIATVPEF
jgi:hypothetical protein